MSYIEVLTRYNDSLLDLWALTNRDGILDLRRLLNIVMTRNEFIMQNNDVKHDNEGLQIHRNECEPLTQNTQIPTEFLAYHCAMKMQNLLTSGSYIYEGHQLFNELFFSLNPSDIFRNLGIYFDHYERDLMVYVIDARKAKESRIQIDYHLSVIWQDRLHTLFDLLLYYNKNSTTITIPYEEGTAQHNYFAYLEGKSISHLGEAIIEEMINWKIKYSAPFNPNRIERYKRKRLDYLLVGGPILVQYP